MQPECSLYRFPFCSLSHFSTPPHPLSLSLFFLRSFLRAPTRRRLRYFFIMHTFAGAIAISFGLVSALSARKSIFTVAEHQRKNVREFPLFVPSLSLFLLLSRKSSSQSKITRSHKFTVKTESFSPVLVSPLSLSNVYRSSFCGERDKAPLHESTL